MLKRVATNTSLTIAPFAIAAVYRAPFGRSVPGERFAFAGLILIALMILAFRMAQLKTTYKVAGIAGIYIGWLCVSLVWSIASPFTELYYLVGDFGMLLLPLVVVLISETEAKKELLSDSSMKAILVAATIAGLLAPIGYALIPGPAYNRYDPPHFIAAVPLAYFAVGKGPPVRRMFAGVLLLLVVWAAWKSGQRTNVAIFGGVVLLLYWMRSTARLRFPVMMMLLLAAGLAVYLAIQPLVSILSNLDSIQGSRFSIFFEQRDDPSLEGRVFEVQDSWEVMQSEWTPLYWVLGAGHGATFQPKLSFPERNIRNGQVHNIHFGPMRMAYRYGISGLLLYAALFFASARLLHIGFASFKRSLSRRSNNVYSREAFESRCFLFGLVLACVACDSVLRNSLNEPLTAISIGMAFDYLAHARRMIQSVVAANVRIVAA